MIYLDHAAATPLDPLVLEAMMSYFSDRFYNPSATYLPAAQVRKDIDAARMRVAHHLGARPTEMVFTAGGTEANNLVIHGVMQQFPESDVVVSSIEHESVLAAAHRYTHRELAVSPQGLVDSAQLTRAITSKTALVSIMYANNEVGTVQPIRRLAQALQSIRLERQRSGNTLPLYFHVDAAQAAAYLDLHVARLGVDFMTINGGKIYGPKGSGALFASHHAKFMPQLYGGGQERGARSGTENTPGIIGLASALDLVQNRRTAEVKRLADLQTLFFGILKAKLPQSVINGSQKLRLPNNVHLTLPGQDNERVLLELEQRHILAAAGSACSASSEEPSHVLRAMGVPDRDARSSLRFTMGHATTKEDVLAVVAALVDIVE